MKPLYSIGKVATELGITVSAVRYLTTKVTGLDVHEVKTPTIMMTVFTIEDVSKMRATLKNKRDGENTDD